MRLSGTGSSPRYIHLRASHLLQYGIAPNSQATYRVALNTLTSFRRIHNLPDACPVPIIQVQLFLAYRFVRMFQE